jgi:hypothetical protein
MVNSIKYVKQVQVDLKPHVFKVSSRVPRITYESTSADVGEITKGDVIYQFGVKCLELSDMNVRSDWSDEYVDVVRSVLILSPNKFPDPAINFTTNTPMTIKEAIGLLWTAIKYKLFNK